ncbi:MAG: hypothetical protein AAB308_07275 [Nitrospirota bacterium]
MNHCLTVEPAYNLTPQDSGLRDYRVMATCVTYSDTGIELIAADGIRCRKGRSARQVECGGSCWPKQAEPEMHDARLDP